MKNAMIGLALAVLAAGTAFAVESGRHNPDADGNGILSRSEAEARAADMFARADINKDGKLDPADREAHRAAHFDRLDTDKDGQLSRGEFTAKPAGPHDGEGDHERGQRGFGPGEGGHHEMGHHDRGHHGGMMGGRLFGPGADTDKDGAITQAEFAGAALRRFDRIDADKNGQVTPEERQAARKLLHEKHRGAAETPAN